MSGKITSVGQLINILKNFDPSAPVAIYDQYGFMRDIAVRRSTVEQRDYPEGHTITINVDTNDGRGFS